MNHEHEHHGGHEDSPSSPPPLLEKPTVTIYFDGLIFSAFNEKESLYQTAVLTHAEGHHLVVEVNLRGNKQLIFPTEELPWDSSHPVVKDLAPFWLYVDSGHGLTKEQNSARLHLPPPEAKDEKSFDRIFNFEEVHKHPFKPKPGTFALFNFPQGTCYSADNVNAKLKSIAQGATAASAVPVKDIDVSTLSAIDIDAVSDGASEKHIVLANQNGQEFFRFPLQSDKHYEIRLLNVPIEESEEEEEEEVHPHHEHDPADPENHFLQFYQLFGIGKEQERFLVTLPEPPGGLPPTTLSPPCVSTTGRPKSGI